MSPNSREFGYQEKQLVFKSHVNRFVEMYRSHSRDDLTYLKDEAISQYRLYLARRGQKVGTRRSLKITGRGKYTVTKPVTTEGQARDQRKRVAEYDRKHLEEVMTILAKIDAVDYLLSQ